MGGKLGTVVVRIEFHSVQALDRASLVRLLVYESGGCCMMVKAG